ncbi:hypothetical protein F4809DRAFT_203555 [Biscogniauxia mediterranea]|nr:hypothetical protein F4809DRAFT_203555 [Biscogniauxia mediterranea]
MDLVPTFRSHQLPTEKRVFRSNESRKHATEHGISMRRLERPASLPLPPREKRYGLSDSKPFPNISLTCKTNMHNFRRCFARYFFDDYNSDEFSDRDQDHDRRRGVPFAVASNAGRALIPAVEAEVASRMYAARALRREIQRDVQRLSVRGEGEMEEVVAKETATELRDEMASLELQTQNLFTQRLSFSTDHGAVMKASPSAGTSSWGRWSRQGDLVVWSMVGAAEEWAERGDGGCGDGRSLPLTYKGVDYNP